MSLRLKKKRTSKNGKATKKNIAPFSYIVVCPLLRRQNYTYSFEWNVMDKGSEKLKQFQKYKISASRLKSAMYKIRKHIWKTPCSKSSLFCHQEFHIYLKEELYQVTNSIKARGVVYSLLQLTHKQKCKGVIAISTGSFAYSLCYYGKILGVSVTIVMPTSTADEQVKKCRDYEATILVQGRDMVEAHNIALRIAEIDGLYYLDGNDHPNMILGQATLGLEILEQMKEIDAVLLPTAINGCGLTTGLAMAIKEYNPNVKVIEVQTEVTDSLIESIRIQTNSSRELEIPMNEYTWYRNSKGLPEMWFDTIITVNKTLVNIAADILLKEENIVDSNAAIGLAAILTGEIHGLQRNSSLLREIGVHIYLKKEVDQHTNSIQARGVIYTLLQLTDEQKRNGVIAISTGYFAQILCYFGQKFKIPVTVVMQKSMAQEIVDKCRYQGATVIVRGDNIEEVYNIALQTARTRDLYYLDGNEHPGMIIGQATLGLEIFEQLDFEKTIDVVILPTTIDACGVTAGIAMAIRKWNSNIKIIEVQTTVQDLLICNVRKECYQVTVSDQNIYVGYANLLKDIRGYLFDEVITVPETLIRKAANFLLTKENINDYYAAIALAGILTDSLNDLIKGKSVLIPLFGRKDDSNNFVDKSSLQPGSSISSS